MRRQIKESEITFVDNWGKHVYTTLKIDWRKELGGYFGLFMQIAEEQSQWIAANSNIRGLEPTDVLQELRLHMLKQIPKYNPKKGSIGWYVKFISGNKIRDLHRASQTDKRKLLNVSSSFDDNIVSNGDEEKRINTRYSDEVL